MKTIVVRCNKCGLCFPEDYFKEWGRKYGRGLGPSPVCEGLSSKYNRPVYPPGQQPRSPAQVMHPLENCSGTMSTVEITSEEAAANIPILAVDDIGMNRRVPILKNIQLTKSGELRSAIAAFTLQPGERRK